MGAGCCKIIFDEVQKILPSIDNMQATVSDKTATIHWDATLSPKEITKLKNDPKTFFMQLQYCVDLLDVEKKLFSSIITYDPNQTHYQDVLKKLKPSTKYEVTLNLAEFLKDEINQLNQFKITFETFEPLIPIPIIDNIHFKSLSPNNATIHWDAKLSADDVNDSRKFSLYMQLKYFEYNSTKKTKQYSTYIPFKVNKINYKYELQKLQKNTKYKMTLAVFLFKKFNKTFNKMHRFKPISEYYQTLSDDILVFGYIRQEIQNKCFLFVPFGIKRICHLYFLESDYYFHQYDFDPRGICYGLTYYNYYVSKDTICKNPVTTGMIDITSSGSFGESIGYISHNIDNKYSDSWYMIDLKNKITIKPTAYSLRHNAYLTDWKLLGENTKNHWDMLDEHENDESLLNKSGKTHTWAIKLNKKYGKFKLQMTNVNSCSGIEIHGTIFIDQMSRSLILKKFYL